MLGTRRDEAALLGRAEEQALLRSLLDDVGARGQALVLRGEPGIGKSRLLALAARTARERGLAVLTTTGVQSEARLPFAGLHQLLRPVREGMRELPAVQRSALEAAFGLAPGVAPEHYRIALATLDLLAEVAADAPLLVVVEDAHWLDPPTAEVLAFVARRIESDPVLILAAARDGYPSALVGADLPERRLAGLDDATAGALLDAAAPHLSLLARTCVLREAAGNPLALLELPAMADERVLDALPLTERLERAFAARVAELPEATRLVVLVAALSDADAIEEILQAAGIVAGTPVELDAAEPAVAAGIADADLRTFRFRHPLIRSAVAQTAGLADRRQIHQALADVLADGDRRAWHRAALLVGEHEDVAGELEAAGARAQQRGAGLVAVGALRRAAHLGAPASRGRRLLAAAGLAAERGRREVVMALLRELRQVALTDLDRARVTWLEETVLTRPLGDRERFTSLIDAAERAGAAGDLDLRVDLLWLVASHAFWVDPGPDVRRLVTDAAGRLGGADAEDPRVLAIHAFADPLGHAGPVLARLDAVLQAGRLDTEAARYFGPIALAIGAFDQGTVFLAAAVDGLRTQGRLGQLLRPLSLYAYMAARLGHWDLAVTAAEEARRLAEELAQPLVAAAANTALALVAAMRGDDQEADRLAGSGELVAQSVGANITVAMAQVGKVLAALATGRYADAYAGAERVFGPADSAYHPVICCWLIADLAEAARHIDQLDAARARVAQVETLAREPSGTWLTLVLGHARALVAEPADAGARYEAALSGDLARWPFQRARLELTYGQWLRRERRISESRAVLRSARDTFDALGSRPWGEQARRELRASGERSRRRLPEARDQLTAQELQIAQLAADGLSNREIGQRLYLSHRTISTHLYRVFPKLGVTSRGELRAALGL